MTMKKYIVTLSANADSALTPGYRQEVYIETDGKWAGSFVTSGTDGTIDLGALNWRDVQTVELYASSVWEAMRCWGKYLDGDDCATRIT